MKRIIQGTTFDTDTSTEIVSTSSGDPCGGGWWGLYQTRHGAFFEILCDYDGEPAWTPLTDDQAQALLEKHANHLVEHYFGPFPEYGSAEKRLTLRMPIALARRIEKAAEADKVNVNRFIMRALEETLKESAGQYRPA
jgi:hypothetical protein